MASNSDFVPTREADLVAFLENFGARITADPEDVGLTPAQCTAFQAFVTAFVAAWELTRSRSTRSEANVIVKNEKKTAVVKSLRQLAGIVQKHPGTTNEQRELLGLTVPHARQAIPVPATSPTMDVVGVSGNNVKARLHEAGSTRRGKPNLVSLAQVYSFVGTSPPADPAEWFFQGATSRPLLEVAFDASLPMGTKVFICAAWANERGEAGPACTPVAVTLLGGAALPTSAEKPVKLAA